jgi:hypothetical protein
VAAAKVTATFREFVPVLVGDQVLPDDIRIAIARKVPAEKSKKASARANKTRATEAQAAERNAQPKSDKDVATTFARLDLLLSIVRDQAASEAGRRRAASDIAEFFLPKAHGRKRTKFPPDEFGFSVDPQLAKEFRDIRWKVACLVLEKDRLPPDIFAKKVSQGSELAKNITHRWSVRQYSTPGGPGSIVREKLGPAVDLAPGRSTIGCSQPQPRKEGPCSTCC